MVLFRLRQTGAKNTVPGMFWNKNAGDPTKWIVDFDRSQPAFTTRVERQATIRVTWQATPRNKFNMLWAEQHLDSNYGKGAAPDGRPVDDTGSDAAVAYYIPSSSAAASRGRHRSRAGWPRRAGACIRRATAGPRNDGTHDPQMIQVLEQGGEVPNLLPRAGSPGAGRIRAFLDREPGKPAGSLTYVTGAHNIKFKDRAVSVIRRRPTTTRTRSRRSGCEMACRIS